VNCVSGALHCRRYRYRRGRTKVVKSAVDFHARLEGKRGVCTEMSEES
jgi:hypothetical protein